MADIVYGYVCRTVAEVSNLVPPELEKKNGTVGSFVSSNFSFFIGVGVKFEAACLL